MSSGTEDSVARIVVEVDPDLMDLIPGFLENRQKDLALLWKALRELDFEPIRHIGHQMAGYGESYGFAEITRIGRCLEVAARGEMGVEAVRLLKELEGYLSRVEVVETGAGIRAAA